MTGEYFRVALLCALGALLIAAAITDLRARIISNRLNLAPPPLYHRSYFGGIASGRR